MGFFDKMKAAASAVTGGAAQVQVRVNGAPSRAGGLSVTIDAHAKGECKVDKVYLKVRCREEADVQDRDLEDDGSVSRETIRARKTVSDETHVVSGPCELEAGAAASWEAQVAFPSGALPSVHGQLVRVVWEMQAGLDMWGNDPDSGWIRIQVD